jgi:hypothetical protein
MKRSLFARALSILVVLTTTCTFVELKIPRDAVAQDRSLTDRYCGSPKDAQERFLKKINLEDGTFDGKPVTLSTSNWRDGVCIYILEVGNSNLMIHRFLNLRDRQSGQISQEFNGRLVRRIEQGSRGYTFADANGKVHEIIFTRWNTQAATPTNQLKNCLSDESLAFAVRRGGYYMVFSQGDALINVQEKPTVNSESLKAVASKESVHILKQVRGDDGYCWLNVKVILSKESTSTSIVSVTGWVRGDLVVNGAD